ncbi:hypothetical protein GLS_c12390 [Gluconobacter oxydans DSM 3504]|uniref:Uncharacterized protein n=1 Tax=Gluconobacter oxydans DSM 3504 TaxID=1288313 RepID=A0A067Z297_GLUOY|nr:hypothetical protein GLS_c12390 [Gluconobacter oxydans DSM 3504]
MRSVIYHDVWRAKFYDKLLSEQGIIQVSGPEGDLILIFVPVGEANNF